MVASNIEVTEGAGKKIQTWDNLVGADQVHAEGIVPVHTDGSALTVAAGVNVVIISGTVTTVTTVTTVDTLTGITNDVSIDDGGNTITVDGTVALGAGAAAIGTLGANSGVDIGDVDVTSVVPGTAATNLGKAEDAAASSGDVGVATLMVRDDSPVSKTNVDGDYINPIADEFGQQKVVVANTGATDSAGWGSEVINDGAAGDNTILAAQGAGNKIAVWSVMVVADGTVDVRFEDGTAGAFLTGEIPLLVNTGFTYTASANVPLWVGSANTLLNLELSAAVQVHGHFSYTVVA